MKKVILGTTALVAATALTAGTASAAEKIKLGLGGYLQTSFIVADYDNDTDQLPTDIRHEGEVFFLGSTTLDNGLTFGVNIQLEARATGDQVDETYMYVSGNFGRINIGSENSADYLMHFGAPSPVPAWSVNDNNANASGFDAPSTPSTAVSDADKITYFTPRFAGFQLGASFTPDADEETGTGASPYAPIKDEGAADEAYSFGANYSNSFGGVALKASLGYQLTTRSDTTTTTTANTTYTITDGAAATVVTVNSNGEIVSITDADGVVTAGGATTTTTTNNEDTDEFSAGLTLGVAGFDFGGSYKYTDNLSGVDDRERHDWALGVTYGQGPWKIGVQYAGAEEDGDTAAEEGELHAFVVGGQYVLGPGITAFGGVQYWSGEDALEGSEGEDATIFFVGTALSF
ncbi:porin [Sneathiella sp. P13V-1]|uniref:porin n=1 Tax=Sneathiella sp. P13V-1 TaxID=2697366 RepID=UPI00187BA70A|nr:porin [Sneathiella sp. P13V-1]MBE7636528.1 porin [Sneathiella sp. P13V-1]